ncbi:hypothetical protein D9758_002523 [Tetrapyrgos nigripes]|uniref:Borealin N-terminal domain-containing protein n=1 Tax=Tetrapyrgos nigripes TaxID=182062 RepID=A0A8H5LTH0_9AGAR|nr:hypothetical protein D9758_002523 [Tetrapyrgos nigripes]
MYSDEEKKQLLANLDIEVAHRTRQFQSWLADCLENFKIHQEGHVSRIPKQVRSLTMKEFCTKYSGNVQLALRGVQKERLAALGAAGAGDDFGEIDRNARKRKWVASQEAEAADTSDSKDSERRMSKNARLASPNKRSVTTTGTTQQRSRLLGTPGKPRPLNRVSSTPSPQKPKPAFSTNFSRPPSRPASPVKGTTATKPTTTGAPRSRVPSTSTFNPILPPKTPGYPRSTSAQPPTAPNTTLRLPRKDENMMMSLNGSPLANPFWDDQQQQQQSSQTQTQPHRTHKRTQSSISIRQDPSFLGGGAGGTHSRSTSQTMFNGTGSGSSSRSHSALSTHTRTTHSRSNSEATLASPTDNQFPDELSTLPKDKDPHPHSLPRTVSSYTVTLSTEDGHLLEFDPLLTSPEELDKLEGISEEAKKQAKEEMGRLVRAAMDKWKIG